MSAKTKSAATLLFGLIMLAACTIQTPLPTSTPVPSPIPPTPTPEVLGIPIEPGATAPEISLHSWSPDGETLAYWTFTEEEFANDLLDPGTLHFLNVQTGQECQPPIAIDYNFPGQPFTWLPDGRIFTVIPSEEESTGQVLVGPPCGPEFIDITDLFPAPVLNLVYPVKPDLSLLVLHTPEGFLFYETVTGEMRWVDKRVQSIDTDSWSPAGTMWSVSGFVADVPPNGVTWVVDVKTGEVEEEIHWEAYSGEAISGPSSPHWLGEDKFIIPLASAPRRESLLVTIGQSVTSIVDLVEKLTGYECVEGSCSMSIFDGAMVDGTNNYHITIEVFIEGGFQGILLYHSESDKAEGLLFDRNVGFSPDGRFLVLHRCQSHIPGQVCKIWELWVRPTDPPNTPASLLISSSFGVDYPGFSPDGEKMAASVYFGEENSIETGMIYIFSLRELQLIGIWNPEPYIPGYSYYGSWSPDGHRSAFTGSVPQSQEDGLFIIEVP